MKKKVLAILIAVVLMAALCSSLVACNDDDDKAGIKFTDKMSKEEIIEKLNETTSMTVEIHYGERESIYYFGETFYCYTNNDNNDNCHFYFVEGECLYDILKDSYIVNYEEKFVSYAAVVDFTGYEHVNIATYMFSKTFTEYREAMVKGIENDYIIVSVEDGDLKLTLKEEDGIYYLITKCNATKMPSLPEEYKNYQSVATKESPVWFTDNDENCVVDFINNLITTYEVPPVYNNKPVTSFTEECNSENLRTLTLPTSIVKLGCCEHDAEDGELQIIYKGTKAQWEQVENHEEWSADKGIKVICTDGEFTE